jgi:hypothetical protein
MSGWLTVILPQPTQNPFIRFEKLSMSELDFSPGDNWPLIRDETLILHCFPELAA